MPKTAAELFRSMDSLDLVLQMVANAGTPAETARERLIGRLTEKSKEYPVLCGAFLEPYAELSVGFQLAKASSDAAEAAEIVRSRDRLIGMMSLVEALIHCAEVDEREQPSGQVPSVN